MLGCKIGSQNYELLVAVSKVFRLELLTKLDFD